MEGDHKGLLLHLRSPHNPVRIQKVQRAFPVPSYAKARVDKFVCSQLDLLAEQLKDTTLTAQAAAHLWDDKKQSIMVGMIRHKREARKSLRNTYRKKLRRLYKQYDRVVAEAGVLGNVDSVANDAEAEAIQTILRRIAVTKTEWLRSRQRRLFREHTWWKGKTTKAFFRWISCKFGDNVIPTLQAMVKSPARAPHEKADILADAWASGFQGGGEECTEEDVPQWMAAGPTADVLELGTPDVITEDRVSAALRACKAGKACGPDRLGNDWYREYDTTLVPLLTRLYKLWYSAHCFPASFLTRTSSV
ncbi:hypothetical protein PR003_g22587 [Phytophthora rubi]|uniref:Uncharacterized protein n=1 Tax=Phytophthora rubi TaxID=129364 RepID=A0A6A4D2U7_9STRA|nr:hypothetical protein PR003_g22587 [Phytophthora rubi]